MIHREVTTVRITDNRPLSERSAYIVPVMYLFPSFVEFLYLLCSEVRKIGGFKKINKAVLLVRRTTNFGQKLPLLQPKSTREIFLRDWKSLVCIQPLEQNLAIAHLFPRVL